MTERYCLGGCGTLVPRGRCASCRRTTSGRGYGAPHQRIRALLAETLPAPCLYGDGMVEPGTRWVAAHVVDGHPEHGYGVAHPACNERAKDRFRAVKSSEGSRALLTPVPFRER